jgi:hypothetical protein
MRTVLVEVLDRLDAAVDDASRQSIPEAQNVYSMRSWNAVVSWTRGVGAFRLRTVCGRCVGAWM